MIQRIRAAKSPILLFLFGLLCQGCSDTPFDPATTPPDFTISKVVSRGSVSQDIELLGRDGGYSALRQGSSHWLFGDSFVTVPTASGDTLLSNSSSQTVDLNAGDGIELGPLLRNQNNQPLEILPYTEAESTFNQLHRGEDCIEAPCQARYGLWPGAIVDDPVRERSIIFYSKISAAPGDFNFESVGQSIAIWPYSEQRPSRPVVNNDNKYPTMLFPAPARTWGNGAILIDNHLYAFACTLEGTAKPCRLARAQLEHLLMPAYWEYLADDSGESIWSTSPDDAAPLFHGNDILSITYNNFLNRYTAIYSRPLSSTIEARSAPAIAGPWSTPVKVTTADPGTNVNGWVYDALAHPEYARENGRIQYLTYSSGTGLFRSELRLLEIELDSVTE